MNVKSVQNIILIETMRKLKIMKNNIFNKTKRELKNTKKQYVQTRIKTDVNYRLLVYTRNRIYKSLKGMMKQSSLRDILGIDIETYRKWIEWQLTPEVNWKSIEIDHVKPICMFDVSKEEYLKEAFSW